MISTKGAAGMIQIQVSEDTADRLRRIAAKKQTDVSQLLDQVVAQYLVDEIDPLDDLRAKDERLAIIDREQAAYEAQHQKLYKRYAGKYIAMHNGKIIDNDVDSAVLWQRVRARYGDETILITPVLQEMRQVIIVRSPRLVQEER